MSEQTQPVDPTLASESSNRDDLNQQPSSAAPSAVDTPRRNVSEDGLREALRAVTDPEIGMNVIELGLIRNIELSDDRCHMVVIMTTPFCPYAPQLLEQIRRTAQEYVGAPTTLEMGMEMWDPAMMEEGAADDWGLF